MDPKVTSAIVNFSSKFCKELEKNKSVVASPLSVEVVLGILALGSSDPSHSQLLKVLGLKDDNDVRTCFTGVCSQLKSVEGVTLDVANKIYLMEGKYNLVEQLKNDAVTVFNAEIEKIDFSAAAAAAGTINKWVEGKTSSRIKELIKATDLGADARIVLVNALYFKGKWKKQFDPSQTTDQPFHVTASSTVKIPMMYKEDTYKYAESPTLKAQLLELPYTGDQASMVIVLPNAVDGLSEVIDRLAGGHDLLADIGRMTPVKVQVTVPKFKIETEIDLNTLLPKLGVSAIFSPNNSGLDRLLDNSERLVVTKAIQKAFIEVNEEGAEAAAATAAVLMLRCAMREPPKPRFCADRPFLAVLMLRGAPAFHVHVHGQS